MSNHEIRMLMLAALVGLGIAGCGGASSPSSTSSSSAAAASTSTAAPPSTTQAVTASTSSTSATATSTSAAPASSSGVVAPGTKLAVGKTALLGYQSPSDFSTKPPTQRVKVTVESIVKGSLADFKGIQLDAAQKAGTPFYVKVRITNAGPGDLTAGDNDPSVQMEGIDDTGQAQQAVSFIGDFPRCNEGSPPTHMTLGKGFDTCLTFLVPGGITAAAYTGTEAYDSSPVTWK
jgi:hypothetical protein